MNRSRPTLEQISSQGLWRKETACQVSLSGVDDLDKWRGARITNRVSVGVRSVVEKPVLYP
jgi:putative transposase